MCAKVGTNKRRNIESALRRGEYGEGFPVTVQKETGSELRQNPTDNLKSIMSDECDVCQNEQLVQQVDSGTTDTQKNHLHIFGFPRFSI